LKGRRKDFGSHGCGEFSKGSLSWTLGNVKENRGAGRSKKNHFPELLSGWPDESEK